MGASPRKIKVTRLRTPMLGLAAFVCIIYGLYAVWEIPIQQIIAVVLAGFMIVAATALAGFLVVGGIHFLRRRLRHKADGSD